MGGEERTADGRRSTHLHGIRRATRRLAIRFAAPTPSIPTPLPFMPNCRIRNTTHHTVLCHRGQDLFCVFDCLCAFFGCDLLSCMGHLIFSFLCKHTSAALRHVCLCARM